MGEFLEREPHISKKFFRRGIIFLPTKLQKPHEYAIPNKYLNKVSFFVSPSIVAIKSAEVFLTVHKTVFCIWKIFSTFFVPTHFSVKIELIN